MSKFSIVPGNVQAQMGVFESCSTTLKDLSGQIDSVGQGLNSALAEMKPALDALSLRTSDHSVTMQKYGLVLGRAVTFYSDSENTVFGQIGAADKSIPFQTQAVEVKEPVYAAAAGAGAAVTGTVTRDKGSHGGEGASRTGNSRQVAYDELDEELRKFVDEGDILVTDDGYFIINKSLEDLLKESGMWNDWDWPDREYYDDWYITGYKDENGNIVYSLLKARELGDDQSSSGWGTGVPFVELDIRKMTDCLNHPFNPVDVAVAKNAVDMLINADKYPSTGNDTLVKYFRDPNCQANYLIADFLVDKAAQEHITSGQPFAVPYDYNNINPYCKDTLDYLAQQGIYDKTNHTITIQDVNNMTPDERRAVLMLTTGNPDKYAYAAENQWHAAMYDDFWIQRSHTVKADATMGEKEWYEGFFKDPDSKYYQQQYEAHGGQQP